MKSIFVSIGNFITRGKYTLNHNSITNDGESFVFPQNSSLNHLISVRLNNEYTYDVSSFRFKLSLTEVQSTSKVGILLKSATDGFDGERAMFVIGNGKISLYWGNTKIKDFDDFDITTFNDKTITLTMRRENTTYYLDFLGKTYSHLFKSDNAGNIFRQNINVCIYGSSITAEISQVYVTSDRSSIKFGLLGDSIAQGLSAAGAGYEDTITGILRLEKGLEIDEFSGSANVVKDTLDGILDLLVIRPKYAIIMYGHNDQLFNTGVLEVNYRKLITYLKNYGIIPVICTMPHSNWTDITIPNAIIRQHYFNDNYIHIELFDALIYPTDYTDIAHPNIQGNRKLAEVIYDKIKNL